MSDGPVKPEGGEQKDPVQSTQQESPPNLKLLSLIFRDCLMKYVYPLFNVLLWAWYFRISSSPCKSQDQSHIILTTVICIFLCTGRLLTFVGKNSLTVFILQNGMHATNLICSSMTIKYVAL